MLRFWKRSKYTHKYYPEMSVINLLNIYQLVINNIMALGMLRLLADRVSIPHCLCNADNIDRSITCTNHYGSQYND